jgi:hypothetical protein
MEADVKLALVFGSVLALTGCATATTSNNNTTEDSGTTPPGADASKDTGTKKEPPDTGAPQNDSGTTDQDTGVPPTDSTCSAETTQSDCEQCCLTVHPSGYNTYHAALQNCLCTSPGACVTECATETCAGNPTTSGDTCDTCVTGALTMGTGACYTAVDTACQGDPDCVSLFSDCIPPCESK